MEPTITQQAQPSTITTEYDVTMLDKEFKTYFDKIKHDLPDNVKKTALKGGRRELTINRVSKAIGGYEVLFRPVIIDKLQLTDKNVLVYGPIKINKDISTKKYMVNATVYFEPEVIWNDKIPGIDTKLELTIPPKPTEIDVHMAVENALKHAQEESSIFIPEPVDTELKEGHVAIVECNSSIDNKPWEPGCVTNVKWYMNEATFTVKDIYNKMIGMKVHSIRIFDIVLPDTMPDKAGQTVHITLRVNQILKREIPQIDNDLAVTNHFSDLESWKKNITEMSKRRLEKERSNSILSQAIQSIIPCAKITPIPIVWLNNKAMELYNRDRGMFKSDKDFFTMFSRAMGTSPDTITSGQILAYLERMLQTTFTNDIIMRSWGTKKGIVKDTQLDKMTESIDTINNAIIAEYGEN